MNKIKDLLCSSCGLAKEGLGKRSHNRDQLHNAIIGNRFWWPNMEDDIIKWIKSCIKKYLE
uniref:Integrase zinc-binding domain-containing protein n=1 Tax=Romanomermis culicivorax TaxID=13658 RepID=A0A915I9G4_ROMCU